jgi:polysaccharide biosynthesis protein PslH
MRAKKKILIVALNFFIPENANGGNKINFNLLKENPYYHADFISFSSTGNCKSTLEEFKHTTIYSVMNTDNGNFLKNRLLNKMKWLFSTNPYLAIDNPTIIKFALKIDEISNNYEIIHLSGLHLAPVWNYLNTESKRKLVLCAIDSPSLFFSRRAKTEKNPLKKLIWKIEILKCSIFERNFYSKVPKVLFVSDVDEKFIIQKFPFLINIGHIPNGVNTEYFSLSQPETKTTSKQHKTIIFTGNFNYSPNKKAAFFLTDEVMPILRKKIPDISLVLAGGNPCKQLLQRESESVNVTGFVDDLRPFMQRSAAFVSPILFGSGMKNKVLEAMALKMIVIGSKVSFDGIDCENFKSCIIQDGFSPFEWVDSIIDVFNCPSKYEKIGINAGKLIHEKYSWLSVQEKYFNFYKTLS